MKGKIVLLNANDSFKLGLSSIEATLTAEGLVLDMTDHLLRQTYQVKLNKKELTRLNCAVLAFIAGIPYVYENKDVKAKGHRDAVLQIHPSDEQGYAIIDIVNKDGGILYTITIVHERLKNYASQGLKLFGE